MFVDVEKIIREHEPNGVLGETLFNDHCHLKPAGDTLMLDAVIPKLIAAATKKRDGKQGVVSRIAAPGSDASDSP